jgi:tetratricopeptide (TPR) repeat protein
VVIWSVRATRIAAAACVLTAAIGGTGAAARQKSGALDVDSLRAWLSALERHAPGQADAPVMEIGSWPTDHTLATLNDFVALVRGRRDAQARLSKTGRASDVSYHGARYTIAQLDQWFGLTEAEAAKGDVGRVLKHAVLLYTDIAAFDAIVPRPASTRASPATGRAPLIVQDGRGSAPDTDDSDHALQWEFARVLANEVEPDPSKGAAIGLWYHAVSAYLESRRQWGIAAAHAERGLLVRPGDPVLNFRRGVIHEFYAGPQAQSARQTVDVPHGLRVGFESELTELRAAEGFFRQAVAGDPAFAEARLHWGRVLGALGRDDAALGELTRARDGLADPVLVYYADLFLGRSHAALGDREGARASYERAAAAFPLAQSPLLAESELARRASDVSGALQGLQRLLTLPEDRRADPWWFYDVSSSRNADVLMAEARAALAGAFPK